MYDELDRASKVVGRCQIPGLFGMIIVDTALKKRAEEGNPIRVGLVGVGFFGRACVNQLVNQSVGIELVAIANRTPDKALKAWQAAGRPDAVEVDTQRDLQDGIANGRPVVSAEPALLCEADGIDVIIEVTGDVAFGAEVALKTIVCGKHFVTVSAELDATLGPLLRHRASTAGVKYTVADGDQPGVEMNLYRFVKTMGFTPLVCGNIKGMLDHYRTPETQAAFAAEWGQSPAMAASFADGTKISYEQAIVANATGMCVEQRGMRGMEFREHIDGFTAHYDVDQLRVLGGVVDFALGAQPAPGVYVFASHDDPRHHRFLEYAKLGKGPLYSFYVPYHLFHWEMPITLGRVVDFGDVVLPGKGPIRVEVVATAKRNLTAGETIDELGGFMTYGACENAWTVAKEDLLPMGIAAGCILQRDVAKDRTLTLADVRFPENRFVDALRAEQAALYPAP
jgi:predicted homoserine dehydrogenase-like protein